MYHLDQLSQIELGNTFFSSRHTENQRPRLENRPEVFECDDIVSHKIELGADDTLELESKMIPGNVFFELVVILEDDP